MNQEMLEPFIGKFVRLIFKKNNFSLYGTIDMCHADAIVFTTKQKTSLISFENIKEIIPMKDRYGGKR